MPKEENYIIEKSDFDYVNHDAEVVIVGITPGNNQLMGSREGKSLKEIKRENAFGGNMRPNLIRMLDYVGVNRLLDIDSCCSLWEGDFDRVEMTSLLKDAVFELKNGEKAMFKDVRKIERSEILSDLLVRGFIADCSKYKKARLFVGLGPGVYDMLMLLKRKSYVKAPVIGMAHPSGANTGRIGCYLGLREPKDRSYVWCQEMAKVAKEIVGGL